MRARTLRVASPAASAAASRGSLRAALGLATIAALSALGTALAAAGQVGPSAALPIALAANDPATTSIAVGGGHACALPGDGTVRCWGDNLFGQLGNGLRRDPEAPAGDELPPPVTVIVEAGSAAPLDGVLALAAGESHTCALLLDTTVRCWGANAATPDGGPFGNPGRTGGQLGDGTAIDRLAPVAVLDGAAPLTGVTSISAGGDYTCAVLADGTVKCWGNAPQTAGLVPAVVMRDASTPLAAVLAVSAGDHHACVLLADGTVACWGVNFLGQLGNQTTEASTFPVQVTVEGGAPLSGVVGIAASHSSTFGPNGIAAGHTCALLANTTVACWGVNDVSQLGNGAISTPDGQPWAAPVIAGAGATEPLAGVEALAAGWAHTCALAGGTVSCWGLSFGQPPGDPTGFQGNGAPVEILSEAVAIATGGQSCAILTDGSVVCWIGSEQPPYVIPELLIEAPIATPVPTATPAPTAAPGQTAAPAPSPSQATGAGPVATSEPGSITGPLVSFRSSVPRLVDITLDLVVMAQSLIIAGAIMLLVPFPGALFNNTLEANYEEVSGKVRGVRQLLRRPFKGLLGRSGRTSGSAGSGGSATGPIDDPSAAAPPVARRPFWQSWLGVAVFALINVVLITFLDPTFWSGATALATFTGLGLGLVVMLVVFNLPAALAYRQSKVSFIVRALPATLAIGVACVLISRLTDFQPGYLYGLIVGLAAAKSPDADDAENPARERAEGRTAAVGTLITLLVGVGAWLALGWLSGAPTSGAGIESSAVMVALETALATMVVAGLEGAALGALPLRFFAGEKMRRWNFWGWLALGAVAGGLFLHILINPSSGYLADSSRTPLATIILLLVAFGIVSVLFWGYFRFRPTPAEPVTHPT